MSEPITISATLHAWVSSQCRMDNLMRYLKEGEHGEAIDELTFSLSKSMGEGNHPWTLVGSAEIKVTLISENEMVASQIQALQAELAYARAEWLTKQQEIMERINKLQALEMTVEG